MSAEDVDRYLRGVDEPKRNTLQALRRTILEIIPDAEEVLSYRVPALRVRCKTVAGFAAFQHHLTKSALHFPVDRPLPKTLVKKHLSLDAR